MSEEGTSTAPNNINIPTAAVGGRLPNESIAVSPSNSSNDSSAIAGADAEGDGASSSSNNVRDDFDSTNICYFSHEPPADPVTFDIEDDNGSKSEQVFERVDLHKWISTIQSPYQTSDSPPDSWRFVKHPIIQAFISRAQALMYIRDVSTERLSIIHRQRERLGLSTEKPSVLPEDTARMNETLRRVLDPK